MTRTRRPLVVASSALALGLVLAGCGSDDDTSTDTTDSSETTTTVADETTTTATEDQSSTVPADEPEDTATTVVAGGATDVQATTPEGDEIPDLVPSSPEWTEACAAGDTLIDQAWQLEAGTLTDRTSVGVTILGMLDLLPEGTATAEVTYVKELLNAYVGGQDLTAYAPDFRTNVDTLLAAVAEGCGLAVDELPLPPDTVGAMESFLFD